VRDAGYKVVFTGEGSDEIIGGYVHFRTDMLMHNAQGLNRSEASRLLEELEAANAVSRGILSPAGPQEHRRSWTGGLSAKTVRHLD
jgi:asparagine synthase (glutamine-hydrolysing)